MFLGILTLLTALTISAVAIYYSVAGLVAIFAAATIPIIIMGGALEIAKLVTTVWLHRYWDQAVWWLKTYLTISVIVLMFITSMGIFGFLSKAHIDQTASATESLAKLEQLDVQIKRQQDIVAKAEQEIAKTESSGVSKDAEIQSQIDKEQARIDSAYTRIQPAIDEQNVIIEKEEKRLGGGLSLYEDQLAAVNSNLQKVEEYIAADNIKPLQALVGVEADGNLGPATERAIEAYRVNQTAEKQRLAELIAKESSNISSAVIDSARAEIQRLRSLAEQEIANSNELINRLRQQLGTTDTKAVDIEVARQTEIITKAEQEIALLTEEKFGLESEYRKLEAEVGPIKYLAEFVYGDTNKDLLEEAVRWVIIAIIFVFDPLAVLLLIASQYTFNFNKTKSKEAEVFRIVLSDQEKENDNELLDRTVVERPEPDASTKDDYVETVNNTVSEHQLPEDNSNNTGAEHPRGNMEVRQRELDELEDMLEWKDAKHQWKIENPDKTIKEFKEAYVRGDIDRLPWESYVKSEYKQNEEQNSSGIWSRIRRDRFDD